MAGYSNTPLINKLGIKPKDAIFVQNAPVDYWQNLGSLPEQATILNNLNSKELNLSMSFIKTWKNLKTTFKILKPH